MQELSLNIEDARTQLQNLLEGEDNLLDPRVIYVSQELDKLLNRYYSLFKLI